MLYTGGERLRWHCNIRATPLAGISAWGCPIPAHNCCVLLSVVTFPSLSCFLQVKNVYECKWFKKFCPDKAAVFQHGLSKYVKGNLSIKCSCALLTLVTGLSVILVGRNISVLSSSLQVSNLNLLLHYAICSDWASPKVCEIDSFLLQHLWICGNQLTWEDSSTVLPLVCQWRLLSEQLNINVKLSHCSFQYHQNLYYTLNAGV